MCWQIDIWDKLNNNRDLSIDDIVNHIYSREYLMAKSAAECSQIKDVYHCDRYKCFFQVEKQDDCEDGKEIFFQAYLDGEIQKKDYLSSEQSFLDFIKILYSTKNTCIYYDCYTPLDDNYPLKKCEDIRVDRAFISNNLGKFISSCDEEVLEQISLLTAREVLRTYMIFPNIKTILDCSGMHGYLISDEKLDSQIIGALSSVIHFRQV